MRKRSLVRFELSTALRSVLIGVCVLLSANAVAADLKDLAGQWDLRVMEGRGPQFGELVIKASGKTDLAGTAITDLRVDGDAISFTFDRNSYFRERITTVKLKFSGTLSNNRMQGHATVAADTRRRRSAETPSGDLVWTATRIGADPAPAGFSGVWKGAASLAGGGWYPSQNVLTPAGKARAEKFGKYDQTSLRCVPQGLAALFGWPSSYLVRIVKAEHQPLFVFHYQAVREVRTIYLDGRKFPPYGSLYDGPMGYSVGQIDGRTLKIVTKNLVPSLLDDHEKRLHQMGEKTTITEQYTLTNDGKYMYVNLTVADPLSLEVPVTRHFVYERTDEKDIPAYTCDPYTFFFQLYRTGKMKTYFDHDPVLGR